MPRKPKLLNVREHLKHVQLTFDLFQRLGACPLTRDEVAKCSVINKAILRKHEESRTAGNRKDIPV